MNKQRTQNTGLLPFPAIRMAADGAIDAINAVLKYYYYTMRVTSCAVYQAALR